MEFWVYVYVFCVDEGDVVDVDEVQYLVQIGFLVIEIIVGVDFVVGGENEGVFVLQQVFWFLFGVMEGQVGVQYMVELVFQVVGNGEVVYWCCQYQYVCYL